MPANHIVITEAYLRRLQKEYAAGVDAIDKFLGKIHPHGKLPGSTVDITQPFQLRLGGKDFTEGVELTRVIDVTRAGLAERFKKARAELFSLEHAIKFLLNDSTATEQMGTLTAQQFEYFVPKSGS
jgi:hypothetical protein